MINKILIANRGEIAVRVARTARRLGISTVAVYSDVDEAAPHVRACDEAVHIGGAAASESYLRADIVIDAAKRTGADAIHPGYGFLSENAAFADELDRAGIIFIGPTAETIRAMGSKAAAKDLMENAGVPTTPGYQGEDQSLQTFMDEARRIGFPVLLKATAGGGGKGMRIVEKEEELSDALASAQREAKSAFGDDRFLVEKYLPRARHLEVQVFGDGKGDAIHLFERDCSVQRRHQKVIEEAPAPNLPADVRARLLQAGVDAAKAVSYRGAGTIEFLYDGAESVYFMEMNTRLQVEHPVTEMITGLDLVEWQIEIANGRGLPLSQDKISESGHAFEARIYAENPAQNFAPSIGTLTTLQLPVNARVDSGVEEGQAITPFYDPMIAKVITHGATRDEALGKMKAALRETRVAGLESNVRFLHALTDHASFINGEVSTRFIDEHENDLFALPAADAKVYAAALLSNHLVERESGNGDPWDAITGFRLNKPAKAVYWIDVDSAASIARLLRTGEFVDATIEVNASADARRNGENSDKTIAFSFERPGATTNALQFSMDGVRVNAATAPHLDALRVWIGADHWDVKFVDPLNGAQAQHSAEGSLTAPMPGVITILKAAPGTSVKAGDPLVVMEAMKMEHAIKAPQDGSVKAFRYNEGDQVKEGDLLVEFEEA